MPTEFTLSDLSKLADVTTRTIRYYIAQGLLPSPSAAGTAARYSEIHLERLRAIKRLQAAHLPLAEIRAILRRGESTPHQVADTASVEPPSSAADYINDLLGQTTFARRAPFQAPTQAPSPSMATSIPSVPPSAPLPTAEPERGTWERIALHPDIELHVRRPLSRLQNKRVERLISIARQLLEEE